MKRCIKCDQVFSDDYSFCLRDGSTLVSDSAFNEIPTVVMPPPSNVPPQRGVNPAFIYAAVGFFAIIIVGAIAAFVLYGLNNQNNPAPNTSTVSQTTQNKNESSSSDDDEKTDELAKEKEDLQKREEKLRREKERLENEKKNLEANKRSNNTSTQTTETTPSATTATVFAPPTNIRESPNGTILCSIKRRTNIEILGSTGIRDNNGVWYFTSACGKTGVIHSTQIRF